MANDLKRVLYMTHSGVPHLAGQAIRQRLLLLCSGHGNKLQGRNQTRYSVNRLKLIRAIPLANQGDKIRHLFGHSG